MASAAAETTGPQSWVFHSCCFSDMAWRCWAWSNACCILSAICCGKVAKSKDNFRLNPVITTDWISRDRGSSSPSYMMFLICVFSTVRFWLLFARRSVIIIRTWGLWLLFYLIMFRLFEIGRMIMDKALSAPVRDYQKQFEGSNYFWDSWFTFGWLCHILELFIF